MSSESSDGSLEDAIQFWRSFLSTPGRTIYERLAASINLANALSDLADETRNWTSCDEAVTLGENALRLSQIDDASRLTILSDLSTIYLTRFELRGNGDDLERSVQLVKQSAEDTSADHPSRCARYANLANVLCAAFNSYGRGNDLQDAIVAAQVATTTNHAETDSVIRAKTLSNRARALHMRYERYEIHDDLQEAIDLMEKAVQEAQDPSTKAICQNNLVGLLISQAERDCSDTSVDRAITKGQQIYTDLPDSHKASLAHNLSYLHRLKFERVGDDGDADTIVTAHSYATAAVDLYAEGTDVAMYLDNLALCLQHRHHLSPSEDYLTAALAHSRSAVANVPHDHPDVATYSNHLADILKMRDLDGDWREALEISQFVFEMKNAPILVRIAAGQQCGFMQAEQKQWPEASESFEKAVNLVQDLARNSLKRPDQQHVLSQLSGLSQSAASAALEAERGALTAFRILEQGRGVLIELAITARASFAPGLESIPDAKPLLERHQELKDLLATATSKPGMLGNNTMSNSAIISAHLQAVEEMKKTEAELRDIANSKGIDLCLDSVKELVETIGDDFAVAFNTTAYRCDAFLISKSGIDTINLPLIQIGVLTTYVRQLLGPVRITKIRSATYRSSNEQLQNILKWLWDGAVQPVLSHLGLLIQHHTGSRLPRVCWITSGALGLMPLHAAGSHTATSKEFTMNYVISSYVASSRALVWCRKKLDTQFNIQNFDDLQAAAITMPTTPGLTSLDFTKDEVLALRLMIPTATEVQKPSGAQVRDLLHSLRIAHFACHAEPNVDDPSAGSVLLYDSDKGIVDRLSIYMISQLHIPSAWLAYLSACQTADLQNLDFLDELVHIAGAFQIAGFPQVVGTLWQAEDDYASSIAREFYGQLALKAALGGQKCLHRDTAVLAFHDAICKVRDEDPELVLSWAQFALFGA
jgi:tetratricopeptide (TPR) repeat protein